MIQNIVIFLRKHFRFFFASVATIALAFMLGTSHFFPRPELKILWTERTTVEPDQYRPSYTPHEGPELVLVYIGSSGCGYANQEELPMLVERAKLAMQREAAEKGIGFSTIGISVDWKPTEGFQHLTKFGLFDEIITGRNWQGTGPRLHMGGILRGKMATPQILVVKRTITAPGDDYMNVTPGVHGETVVTRKTGVVRISAWARQGFTVPIDYLEPLSK